MSSAANSCMKCWGDLLLVGCYISPSKLFRILHSYPCKLSDFYVWPIPIIQFKFFLISIICLFVIVHIIICIILLNSIFSSHLMLLIDGNLLALTTILFTLNALYLTRFSIFEIAPTCRTELFIFIFFSFPFNIYFFIIQFIQLSLNLSS